MAAVNQSGNDRPPAPQDLHSLGYIPRGPDRRSLAWDFLGETIIEIKAKPFQP